MRTLMCGCIQLLMCWVCHSDGRVFMRAFPDKEMCAEPVPGLKDLKTAIAHAVPIPIPMDCAFNY